MTERDEKKAEAKRNAQATRKKHLLEAKQRRAEARRQILEIDPEVSTSAFDAFNRMADEIEEQQEARSMASAQRSPKDDTE